MITRSPPHPPDTKRLPLPGGRLITDPVTLGDLITAGKLLWCYCLDCCHERDVEPASLCLSADTPVPGLGERHMRCSNCGSRKIETKPELYSGGIEKARMHLR